MSLTILETCGKFRDIDLRYHNQEEEHGHQKETLSFTEKTKTRKVGNSSLNRKGVFVESTAVAFVIMVLWVRMKIWVVLMVTASSRRCNAFSGCQSLSFEDRRKYSGMAMTITASRHAKVYLYSTVFGRSFAKASKHGMIVR